MNRRAALRVGLCVACLCLGGEAQARRPKPTPPAAALPTPTEEEARSAARAWFDAAWKGDAGRLKALTAVPFRSTGGFTIQMDEDSKGFAKAGCEKAQSGLAEDEVRRDKILDCLVRANWRAEWSTLPEALAKPPAEQGLEIFANSSKLAQDEIKPRDRKRLRTLDGTHRFAQVYVEEGRQACLFVLAIRYRSADERTAIIDEILTDPHDPGR